MASEVEICNLALSHIRGGSINSFTEVSIQAQQCELWYPVLRDQMLQGSPWQFSRSIKALALLDDQLFNWVYVYQYPSDALYINRLILNFTEVDSTSGSSSASSRFYDRDLIRPDLDMQIEHKIYNIDGNKVIACNESELRVDYQKKITDPNLFSSNFILALSHLIASNIAVAIVGVDKGRGLRSDELKIYQEYLRAGLTDELNEQYTETPDSEFITIRR